MLARLLPVWEKVRTGLWFTPAIISVGAAGLAWLALQVPGGLPPEAASMWWLHGGDATDAFDLLANLLTALITMATLALSITMVVLTLAAAQLGPRLIRSFIADQRTQLVLGLFIGTIVYLVLVLRTLHGELDADAVPRAAVTAGTALVLLSVFALLFYVHHLARSIVADTMIQRVGAALDQAIRAQLAPSTEAPVEKDGARPPGEHLPYAEVEATRGGYVQTVDVESILAQAQRDDAIVALDFRPGHHLLAGCALARVWPPTALGDALREAVREAVVIGDARTAAQDVEFSLRQLVEIALRALSSGINDPHTAVAVVDRLGRALALAMAQQPGRRAWRDQEGVLRLHARFPDFDGIVDAALNEIRQAAQGNAAVLIHLLATLDQLAGQTRHADHRRIIGEHVRMVAEAGRRSLEEPRDLAALEARRARALARLEDARGA
ncbi:DUF2254 domain-containing protein [Ectothiorhodospiraceae bacterium 2226]|nr:DUF2254 domain-containing protein [Ectothiorhodospiraceae bacterium 2226]